MSDNIVIPEGADLDQVAAAVGVDPDERPELDTESVDYQAARPPHMQVFRAFVVMCDASGCGMVAARDSREQANQAMKEHKDRHIALNRRAEALLKKFRSEQLAREQAKRELGIADNAISSEDIETKGMAASDRGPIDRVDEEIVPDYGYMDWQFGSAASGRDPNKMWHRGCGGEVVIVDVPDAFDYLNKQIRVRTCLKCHHHDTEDGTLNGEVEGKVSAVGTQSEESDEQLD